MNTQEQLAHVQQILNTPLDDLVTGSKTGSDSPLRFGEVLSIAQEFQSRLQSLDASAIQLLPASRQKALWDALGPIFNQFEVIRSTKRDPGQSDIQQKRGVLRFFNEPQHPSNQSAYQQHLDTAWPLIIESIVLSNSATLRATDPFAGRSKELNDIINQSVHIKGQLETMLDTAKEELGKVGVAKHGKLFDDQANEYMRQANFWYGWSIKLLGLNAVLIVSVLVLVLWVLQDRQVIDRIEVGIFGAALVSLVSFGLVLCVRNYFAAKHNEIVNRHKANCLGTYNTFVDSADPERKAAVLIQATQTIFSHQRTGYLTKEAEVSSPNPIVEVVRNMQIPGSRGATD